MKRLLLMLLLWSGCGGRDEPRQPPISKPTPPNAGSGAVAAAMQDRVALVIGNAAYAHINRLNSPEKDARDISAMFQERLGIGQTTLLLNGSQAEMNRQIAVFAKRARGKAAIVYYSGHGVQFDNENYLVPVDAPNAESSSSAQMTCISVNQVIKSLSEAGCAPKILILDACRNNPFKSLNGLTSGGKTIGVSSKGLAKASDYAETFISFATDPNDEAPDGKSSNENSPYTAALLQALPHPNLLIEQIFRKTQQILKNSGSTQNPWYNASISEDFVFLPQWVFLDYVETVHGVSFVMKAITGGTFQMGSNDKDAADDVKPAHTVTVSSFYMGQFEVTLKLWKAVMADTTSYFKNCYNCPVEDVSWDDAQVFIRKLNSLTGKKYRLPTEAEWEYAAKGGQSYKYAGSNDLDEVGWHWRNSGKEYFDADAYIDQPRLAVQGNENASHPVGSKQGNGYGLYDMSGNVSEWCDGWYSAYGSSPTGAAKGLSRVARGGNYNYYCGECSVITREIEEKDYTSCNNFGFRVVLSL